MAILDKEIIKDKVINHLKHIFDPEIPINIYDLGIIYSITLKEKENYLYCLIKMTLTSPACPVADNLLAEVQYYASSIPEIDEVEIDLTFDPPWDISKISDEGKEIMLLSGVQI